MSEYRVHILPGLIAVLLWTLPAHAKTERSQQVTRDFQLANPCPSTGKPTGACPGWIKDHIIPLCKGGPDRVDNLQWQTVEDAKAKDRVECK